MKKQIENRKDIEFLVDAFYSEIRKDDLLKDIFNQIIQDKWPAHLEKMYRFWETVLLEEHSYFGSPFVPHAKLKVERKHFERWLQLFSKTLDEHFTGEKAIEAKWRAEKMAEMFLLKIQYYQNNPSKPVI
ncbi:MAG: group III truncated hemoglobin [Chitinophagales bacterium]